MAALRESIARLRTVSPASDIFVIGPVPNWSVSLQKNLIDYLADNEHFPRYMQQGLTPQASQWDAFFNNQLHQSGSTYLSAQKVLCTANGCLTSVDGSIHGLTAVDWGHLTKAGSIYLIENIAPRIFE